MLKEVEKAEFLQLVNEGRVLVDFFSSTCGPCKMLSFVLNDVDKLLSRSQDMIVSGNFDDSDELLVEGNAIKAHISQIRHKQQDRIQREDSNIKVALLYLNTLQELQELVSMTRHLLRASKRFQA